MPNVFLISDTHFGHQNMLTFLKDDGTRLRPLWELSQEMDQHMIDNWNKVVKPLDKVYHLGDVSMSKHGIKAMYALNGKKCLIKGNHDIHKLSDYTPHFYDIRACHKLDNCILSHIPIHPQQLERFKGNIHGHLHEHLVTDNWGKPDPRYLTMCVEHINFTPVELSVALQHFK